jgi:hypothetical protein
MSHLHAISLWARRFAVAAPVSLRANRFAVAALTSLAAGSILMSFAPPAMAEGSATFEGAPADGAQITSGGPISMTLTATAGQGERVTHFTARLESVSGVSPAYAVSLDQDVNRLKTYSTTMSWNPNAARSADAANPATDANGTYRLTTTTETCTYLLVDCDPGLLTKRMTTTQSRTYTVNISPRVPTGVKVEMGSNPVVSWNRNAEGDLTEYRILRSDSGPTGEFRKVGTAARGASSWTDNCTDNPCAPGGSVAYKVAAVRTSPLDNAGCAKCIVSAASASTEGVTIPGTAADPAAAAAPANPLNIPPAQPAPLPAVKAPAKQIVAPPPVSDKYAPTLPYAAPAPQQGAAPVEAPSPSVAAARAEQQQQTAQAASEEKRLPKAQFIAGALVLLVAAMHLARGGGMLLRGPAKPAAGPAGGKGMAEPQTGPTS